MSGKILTVSRTFQLIYRKKLLQRVNNLELAVKLHNTRFWQCTYIRYLNSIRKHSKCVSLPTLAPILLLNCPYFRLTKTKVRVTFYCDTSYWNSGTRMVVLNKLKNMRFMASTVIHILFLPYTQLFLIDLLNINILLLIYLLFINLLIRFLHERFLTYLLN